MPGYNPSAIEKKWQNYWRDHKTYATDTKAAATGKSDKPKYYVLDMFPYPSGKGLHVGHPEGYTATDIIARYKRANGFNVMHPMGWDAFGLPAEQTAIKENIHPRVTTARNIATFRGQLQALGFSYDWDREVDTTDPRYYKWSQWIFLKLYDTWFDEQQQKGRPISELIEEFKSRKRPLPSFIEYEFGNTPWDEIPSHIKRHELSKYRLAYEAEVPVNWCPGLGTVLANEEVIDGKSEVGGFPVERRPMRQWMLRITAYSERLINGLTNLQWSDSLKEMQRNWIGRSEGAEVHFAIEKRGSGNTGFIDFGALTVFTTRPDTLFGATYMVVAPEHPYIETITTPEQKEKVEAYRKWAASRSDRERQEDTRKTGEFTGAYAINPVNNQKIPIYVADYVLMGYGTGAIMAVPAHDERDHEFATKFSVPIIQVVAPKDGSTFNVQRSPFTEEGTAINSPWIEGLPTQEAKSKIIDILEEKGIGKRRINYKIRDWLFSRQRYWGEPFPIVHLEDGTNVRLADDQLPLELPELEDFKPTGTIDPPLSKAPQWFNVYVKLETVNGSEQARVVHANTPGAIKARRELNTMPQWAGSCWYYLRYLDPKNDQRFVDPQIEKYWMHNGVDLYVGGVEHAVLHLLYSRFWHKVLFDWNLVSSDEPFQRLVNQGLILGEMEYSVVEEVATGKRISAVGLAPEIERSLDDDEGKYRLIKLEDTQVEKKPEGFVMKADPTIRVDARSFKMSKSRGNVVNPDDVIKEYGADSLRLFEMFMGPLEQVKPWSTAGVEGVYRFLQRVWRNLFDENDVPRVTAATPDPDLQRVLHKTIKKVGEDIERLSFNTAIPAMMEFNNAAADTLRAGKPYDTTTALTFLRLLEPFAPHFAEEAHQRLTGSSDLSPQSSISLLPWPAYNPALLVESTLELPVQVNGKLRSRISVPADADETTILNTALADPETQKFLAGKDPKKKLYIKGRMVNLVV